MWKNKEKHTFYVIKEDEIKQHHLINDHKYLQNIKNVDFTHKQCHLLL
jgi:pantothenate kinase